ncbi:DUF1642 domain-containing protein [Streptococcus suis]|nr:DUF1642 domain-containing protein [Streptococcus suis]
MNKQEAIEIIERDKMRVGKLVEMNSGAHSIQQKMKLVDYVPLEVVVNVINQIHEPQKVVVPKFVADWLEWCKENSFTLSEALSAKENKSDDLQTAVNEWLTSNREDLFAQAWLFGFEIEQEKLYTVEVVGTGQYLDLVERYKKQGYVFTDTEDPLLFTKSELEAAGFGWVFDCNGVKVVEVE